MRTPSQYVPAAFENLRTRLMADCAETLRFGNAVANVVRVGSPARGEDEANSLQMIEHCRVLALASELPGISRGATVDFHDSARFVTSARTNPTTRTLIVGMTDRLEDLIWTRDAPPHVKATFKAAMYHVGDTQNAGSAYVPVIGNEWIAFICPGGAEVLKISPGDTLTRGNGTVLTVQRVNIEEHVGWVLRLTTDMKGVVP